VRSCPCPQRRLRAGCARRQRGHRCLIEQRINGSNVGGVSNQVRVLKFGAATTGKLRRASSGYRGGREGGAVRRRGHRLSHGWLTGRAVGVEIEQRRSLGDGRRRSLSGEFAGEERDHSHTFGFGLMGV
jgi:hypothetical protein